MQSCSAGQNILDNTATGYDFPLTSRSVLFLPSRYEQRNCGGICGKFSVRNPRTKISNNIGFPNSAVTSCRRPIVSCTQLTMNPQTPPVIGNIRHRRSPQGAHQRPHFDHFPGEALHTIAGCSEHTENFEDLHRYVEDLHWQKLLGPDWDTRGYCPRREERSAENATISIPGLSNIRSGME